MRIIQMQISVDEYNYKENICKIEKFLNNLEYLDSVYTLVLLPELFCCGFTENSIKNVLFLEVFWKNLFKKYCLEKNIAIAGTLPIMVNNHIYNKFMYCNTDGYIWEYDKLHLCPMLFEHKIFTKGSQIVSFYDKNIHIGLSICYDLRFPELFRLYALRDVSVMLVAAAWPLSRRDILKNLTQARAIENQYFVVMTNRAKSIDKFDYAGFSSIYGPGGELISEASEDEEIIVCDLNLDDIKIIKDRIHDFREERRKDIYIIKQV